jgi:hypothetical protein
MTMNDRDQDPPVDDLLLDRIVNGGMSALELRTAVRALEREPDGWKRCATAFLEAQALCESFRAMGLPQKDEAPSQVLRLDPGRDFRGARQRWLRHAAAAGIVAVSFAIGWIAHGTRPAAPTQDLLAVRPVANQTQPIDELAVSESRSPSNAAQGEDVPESRGGRDERAPDALNRTIRTVARIRFGAADSPAEVPVLDGPGITGEWLAQQPPPVSEHGQVVLERQGYQVDQRRQFLRATLSDGRRVAVPVDRVRIQYTGNEPL